jgi:hypothetical protein
MSRTRWIAAVAVVVVLASSCKDEPRGRKLPARWHGAIRPIGPVTLNTPLKYDFTLSFDSFVDGKVTGTMEWPSEIRTNKVSGTYDGDHMVLEDDDGDKKDVRVYSEPAKGCFEGSRGKMRGTDKNGRWQLDAMSGQSAPVLVETTTSSGAAQ